MTQQPEQHDPHPDRTNSADGSEPQSSGCMGLLAVVVGFLAVGGAGAVLAVFIARWIAR